MATETVQVKEVLDKGNGWFDVSLEDDRIASTKNVAIAEHARTIIGAEVEAVINVVKTGRFTNTYLNGLDGVADRPSPGARSGAKPAGGSSYTPKDQDRIARQWSYGRAVELLMASGEAFELPLDKGTQDKLQATADWLLSQTK